MDNANPIEEMFQDNERRRHETALNEAYANLGQNGVWTMSLSVNRDTGAHRQCFASMNAVDTTVAKWVAAEWLRCKYGNIDIEFRQNKAERLTSTEDRVYFHALFNKPHWGIERGEK